MWICDSCGGIVFLIEAKKTFYSVDKNGKPDGIIVDRFSTYYHCDDCGVETENDVEEIATWED